MGETEEKHQRKRVKLKINVFCLNSVFERGKFRETSPGPHSSKPFLVYVCVCQGICQSYRLSRLSVVELVESN